MTTRVDVDLTEAQLDALYLVVAWMFEDDGSDSERAAVRVVLQPVKNGCCRHAGGCTRPVALALGPVDEGRWRDESRL